MSEEEKVLWWRMEKVEKRVEELEKKISDNVILALDPTTEPKINIHKTLKEMKWKPKKVLGEAFSKKGSEEPKEKTIDWFTPQAETEWDEKHSSNPVLIKKDEPKEKEETKDFLITDRCSDCNPPITEFANCYECLVDQIKQKDAEIEKLQNKEREWKETDKKLWKIIDEQKEELEKLKRNEFDYLKTIAEKTDKIEEAIEYLKRYKLCPEVVDILEKGGKE